MKPIKITFIPKRRPFIENATSRLRACYLVDQLNKDYPEKYQANLDDPENADIIVINQSMNEEDFYKVKRVKDSRNIFIIYDIVGRQYDSAKARFERIVEAADLITVSNKLQRERIRALKTGKPCCILPDGIDYFEQLDPTPVPANKKVVWFGNHQLGNLDSSKWALKFIASQPDYSVSVIGTKGIQLDGAELIEWQYDGFIKRLKQFGICYLSHDDQEKQKSNNRLLVAIANGIPTIVGRSPAFTELMQKFNLDYAIVENENELQRALEILNKDKERKNYLRQIQPYILKKYNFSKISKRFDAILMKYYPNS